MIPCAGLAVTGDRLFIYDSAMEKLISVKKVDGTETQVLRNNFKNVVAMKLFKDKSRGTRYMASLIYLDAKKIYLMYLAS